MTASTSGTVLNGISPVGTVLGPGSTNLNLEPREYEIATLVAYGYSYKRIAGELGLSDRHSVGATVAKIAERIPGEANPRQKVACWMYVYGTSQISEVAS